MSEITVKFSVNFSPLIEGLRQVGVSARQAQTALYKMKRALVLIDAPTKAGDWPDGFSLLNRYLRTDLVPENISGERWEA